MRGILKFLAFLGFIAVIVCGVFLGKMFLTGNALRKDLTELESYNFEVSYHISGDNDVLNMSQYETENTPALTKWFASYIKKMAQGGSISGMVHDDVYHAEVYAEGEEQSSIDFYYHDQAVFGVKKTLDYIISSVAKETDLPISLLQNVTPNGYISSEQIGTLLGIEQESGTADAIEENVLQMNLMKLGKELLFNLKLILPTSVNDNYFQTQLDGVDMSYCRAKTSLNGEEIKITVGISNETYHKCVYIRIDDINGKEGSALETLLYIKVTDNEPIQVPETISDKIIDTMASMISLINGFAKK